MVGILWLNNSRRSYGEDEMYLLGERYLQGSQAAEAFCTERGITLAQLY